MYTGCLAALSTVPKAVGNGSEGVSLVLPAEKEADK